jgi:hypothetical protein
MMVGALAAALTVGAGLRVMRGPVAETKLSSAGSGERFEWVDVYVSGERAVGAWQVELKGDGVKFVGVEGADGAEPPVYDAVALSGGERLVVGGMCVASSSKAPSSAAVEPAAPSPPERGEGGRVRIRVARVHVMVRGSVEYAGVLAALGDVDGKRIGGTVELVRGEAGQP